MKKRALILALAVLPRAGRGGCCGRGRRVRRRRRARPPASTTSTKAIDAGYTVTAARPGGSPVHRPARRGRRWAIHMLNPSLLDGDDRRRASPELLVYERRNDGSMKLVAARVPGLRVRVETAGRPSSASPSTRSRPATATAFRRPTRCTPGSGSRTRAACSTPGTRRSTAAPARVVSSASARPVGRRTAAA